MANQATKIIIGTTPTITYTFHIVSVQDILVAYLTIKLNDTVVVRKPLSDATIGENSLSWTLTQEETLALGTGTATMMLNWKTQDGTRGASDKVAVAGSSNHISEVI